MPCSLCKKTGHNRSTCQRKYSTDSAVVVNPSNDCNQEIDKLKIFESDPSLSKAVKYRKPKNQAPVTVETNKKSNEIWNSERSNKIAINRTPSEENRKVITNSTQPVVNGVKCPNNSNFKPKSPSAQINKIGKSNKTVSNREASEVYREVNTKADENKNITSEISRCTNQKANATKDHKSRINSSFRSRDLAQSKALAPVLEITESKSTNKAVKKTWKDIKIEDGDKDILCRSAMERFFEGPTNDEGDGYIYMYTYKSDAIVTAKQESTFKIGMTKNLPERRIQVLEHGNHEKYVKIHSEKVTYRRLAENLIHKQLTANGHHYPREDVKGGTEWFKGSRDEILDVIHLVIRFLNAYALPLQQI